MTTDYDIVFDDNGRVIPMNPIFDTYSNCSNCPCKNACMSYGDSCNLGAKLIDLWDIDEELFYGSSDCPLIKIESYNGNIIPSTASGTELHPSQWVERSK